MEKNKITTYIYNTIVISVEAKSRIMHVYARISCHRTAVCRVLYARCASVNFRR